MLDTNNNAAIGRNQMIFRIGYNTLSFAMIDAASQYQVAFEPYIIKSGISMAANLREAFAESELLSHNLQRAQVMIDAPTMLIPIEEYNDQQIAELYLHTFIGQENNAILHTVLPNLNAIAVFSINKDLKMVITDHFNDVRFHPVAQPVWSYLHKRSYTGINQKLYAYFHDKSIEIFSFRQNRFKFCNTFHVSHANDSLYYLLYTWKTLALDAEKDELHLAGEVENREWLTDSLRKYVQKTYFINPSAEFNRAPVSQIKGMPFDLITLFLKGKS